MAVQVGPDFGFLRCSKSGFQIGEEDELVRGRIPVRDRAGKACRDLADVAHTTDRASVAGVLLTDVGEFVGQEAPALFGSGAILPGCEGDIGAGGVGEGIDGPGGFGCGVAGVDAHAAQVEAEAGAEEVQVLGGERLPR